MSNPNGQNQMWSKWVFDVLETGRHVSKSELTLNAARWLRLRFGSAGRARVETTLRGYRIEAFIEGRPAHDPGYVEAIRREFNVFVEKGWSLGALGTLTEVRVLAGNMEDGKPARQVVEIMPVSLEHNS